jgi:hypothetical protein
LIYIIITSLTFALSDGIKEGHKLEFHYKELNGNYFEADQHNRLWHKWQFVSHTQGLALGFSIALNSFDDDKIDWLNVTLKSFLSGAIFYNVRDIAMNITRYRQPFASATHNYSGLSQFDFLKIPILITAIILNYIYDN